jgi:MFS family permease
MTLGSFPLSIYLIGNLKTYGQETINIETVLATSATLSSVFSIFRFVWSFALEKYSYKSIYGTLLVIQLTMSIILPILLRWDAKNLFTQAFYIFVDCACKMTMGGHMVLVPTAFAKIYGPDGGMRTFSVGFSFATVASLMNTIVTGALLSIIGYEGILYFYCGLTLGSLIYLIFFYKYRKITSADLE